MFGLDGPARVICFVRGCVWHFGVMGVGAKEGGMCLLGGGSRGVSRKYRKKIPGRSKQAISEHVNFGT